VHACPEERAVRLLDDVVAFGILGDHCLFKFYFAS